MFLDKYFFVIFLAYLATFLIVLLMAFTTWISMRKVKKSFENMTVSKTNIKDEKV